MGVAVGEGAVLEAATGGSRLGSCNETAREIDAGGVDLWVFLGKSTGIEARAAAKFEDMSTGDGAIGRKESVGDLLSVIAEEVLAAEGVEPGAGFEEAVRWAR